VFRRFGHLAVLFVEKYQYGEKRVANSILLKIIYHVKSPYIGLKNVQKVFDKNPKM
jgi:hypothetical protein